MDLVEMQSNVQRNVPPIPAPPIATARIPYRWIILLMCFMVMMISFLVRIAWANAAMKAGHDLSLTATMLGAFITAFFSGYVITNTVAGMAVDRYGAKRTVCVSLIPLAASVAAFGAIQNMTHGLMAQFVMGLSAGLDFAATTKLAAAWFPIHERGRAFGILSTASSSSLIIANILFLTIIEHKSWHALYYALGGGVLGVAVLCFLVIRDRPAEPGIDKAAIASENYLTTVVSLLRDRNYVFLTIVFFGALWGTWGVIFWSNALMVKGHGFSEVVAGEITTLIGIGGLFAKPSYGWLSDILPFRRKTMLFPCFVGFVVILLLFGAATSEWEFLVLAPFVGVFTFVCQPLLVAMLTEIVGNQNVGTASGIMNALGQSSTIIAPLIVGSAFQATHSFFGAFAALAVGPFLGSIFILLIRERKQERK
jgi:sugar phosphate permease